MFQTKNSRFKKKHFTKKMKEKKQIGEKQNSIKIRFFKSVSLCSALSFQKEKKNDQLTSNIAWQIFYHDLYKIWKTLTFFLIHFSFFWRKWISELKYTLYINSIFQEWSRSSSRTNQSALMSDSQWTNECVHLILKEE